MNVGTAPLAGKTILIVEDEFLVGLDLCRIMEEGGARVIGPIADPVSARSVVLDGSLDGALLDVHLGKGTSEAVAHGLVDKAVPFIVVSGYEPNSVPIAMRGAPYVPKPILRAPLVDLAAALF